MMAGAAGGGAAFVSGSGHSSAHFQYVSGPTLVNMNMNMALGSVIVGPAGSPTRVSPVSSNHNLTALTARHHTSAAASAGGSIASFSTAVTGLLGGGVAGGGGYSLHVQAASPRAPTSLT